MVREEASRTRKVRGLDMCVVCNLNLKEEQGTVDRNTMVSTENGRGLLKYLSIQKTPVLCTTLRYKETTQCPECKFWVGLI
jgi:hypothetical protein